MALTLYGPSSGAAAITPAIVNAGWSRTSAGIQRLAALTTDTTGNATWSDSSQASLHSSCLGQWIYGPLAGQSISGTLALTITGKGLNFTTQMYTSALACWIAKPDATLRATLLAKTADPNTSAFWSNTFGSFSVAAVNLTTQTATAGDYLILEAGLDDATFTDPETGSLRAGGSSTFFTFNNSIQTQSAQANTVSIPWGRPQPRGR